MSWNMPAGASPEDYDRFMGYDQREEVEVEAEEELRPREDARYDKAANGKRRIAVRVRSWTR